jgi:hypothetical protein
LRASSAPWSFSARPRSLYTHFAAGAAFPFSWAGARGPHQQASPTTRTASTKR